MLFLARLFSSATLSRRTMTSKKRLSEEISQSDGPASSTDADVAPPPVKKGKKASTLTAVSHSRTL